MRFTAEQRLDDGVVEREFTLGEIPGILWTPGSASAPAPLILLGHPGGLHKMYPRLAGRARPSAAEYGFAAATIEEKTLHANMGGHTGVPQFDSHQPGARTRCAVTIPSREYTTWNSLPGPVRRSNSCRCPPSAVVSTTR